MVPTILNSLLFLILNNSILCPRKKIRIFQKFISYMQKFTAASNKYLKLDAIFHTAFSCSLVLLFLSFCFN